MFSRIVKLCLLAVMVGFSTSARAQKEWVETSNEIAMKVLELQVKYVPEFAAAQGIEGYDEEIFDLKPNITERQNADARAMIAEVRGLGSGDIEALASAICAVSDLARVPEAAIEVAEINPLIVKAEGDGVVAVDGLVVRMKDAEQ